MKLSPRILTFSIIIAAGTLGLGYALNGKWPGALLFVTLGLLWLAAQHYRKPAIASVGLVGIAMGAGLGALYEINSGWLLSSLIAALVAWDLHYFVHHIQDTQNVENRQALERAHLQRLGVVGGLGLLLSVLALTVRLTLGFGIVLGLGLLAVFGLSRLIRYLRQESD